MVNQWLDADPIQIGMLLKMICKFNDLPAWRIRAMASDQ